MKMNNKKYTVYLTTNLVNNKIYIGVHGTYDPETFDYYLGDGVFSNKPSSYMCRCTPFHCAVAKYGPKNFNRKIIQVFDTEEEALELERQLVNQEFIERTDTYNITLGGGMPPKANKHIFQYDLNGNFIKEWESIKIITDFYNVNKDRVRMVINDKRSFEQSYWSEIKHSELNLKEYRPSSRGSIRQYTTDGVFLKSFKNTTEASEELDIERQKITNAICGKYATGGFWFLKEDEIIEDYLSGKIKEEKPIYCYNEDGSFYKKFYRFKDIREEFKFNKPDLKRAIKNNSMINNHYWSYSEYNNFKLDNPEYMITNPKKIYQYTLEGDFVREWDSINECKKEFPSVLQVLLGNRLHCHKFKFTFDKLKI